MRELALAGLIAAAFGIGSYYATGHFGAFSAVNLTAGASAVAAALVLGARRLRITGGPHSRPIVLRGLLLVAAALVGAVLVERAFARANLRFDWTFEKSYQLDPALASLLDALPGLSIDLFRDPLDPRVRRTRLLLEELARGREVAFAIHDLDQVPEALDDYDVGASNTVLLRRGQGYQVVERPTQGSLYEALYRLSSVQAGVVAFLRGEGEGDPEVATEHGYAGLASMLATEGYEIRALVTMATADIPEDVDVVVAIAPERALPARALDALRGFLRRGGGLVALIEPGTDTGLEALLAEWGMTSADRVLVDPAHGEGQGGEPAGVCPLAYLYEEHPVTRGLDRNRMTFFCGVRSFELRKPSASDSLRAVVQSSPRAWLSDDLGLLAQRGGEPAPDGARQSYHPIAVAGHYPGDGAETRIFAVGDADFASNRYLRALYNLDLAVNAVHWTAERDPQIAIRPKIRDTVQFPLPVESSLQMLYGVGLLVPELLLIAGGAVWLRRRRA
jgi:hypothetical protein